MKAEYRIRLEQYLSSMLQAKRMLEMGILTREDYAEIDTILAEKYGLESCNICFYKKPTERTISQKRNVLMRVNTASSI